MYDKYGVISRKNQPVQSQRRIQVFETEGEIVGSYVPGEGRLSMNSMAVAAGKSTGVRRCCAVADRQPVVP